MATNQTIKLKRGTSTPTTSNIASGEVAIDTSAKKFYVNDDGTVKEIGGGGVTGITSFTSTAEIMRISSSDKIGIGPGVGNASARLQVYQSGSGDLMKIQNGNGAAQIRFTNADNNETYFGLDASGNIVIDGVENDSFILSTNNTERLRVLNSGNVGIGTTTPTQALDVNGTVELNNLTVGGAQGSDGQVLTSTGSGVGWEDKLAGVTAITISGELDAGSLDISGDIDVDGTTNLDVVDIDGAVDMASTLAVGGVATFSDHITLADSKYVKLGNDADFIIYHDGTSNYVQAAKQDSDIILRGNDGGSGVNMLTLDTSAAGLATFNAGATFGDSVLVGTTTQQYAGTDLTVGSTSDAQNGIQITTSTSGDGYVLFGDGSSTDAFRGQVRYNHGSDFLALTTAGSERVRVDSSGNVGIGTTAPAYTLDVDSTIHLGNDGSSGYTQSRLIFDCNAATRGAGVYFHNQANDVEWFAGNPYTSSDSFDITRQATTSHAESTANHTLALMTINGSTGNLGIGLATPTSRLHVNDDTDDGYVARFSQDHATGYGVLIDVDGTANGDPALVVNNAAGTTGLYVSQAGNVGIGNTAPTQKLDVNGTVELNNLTVGGSQGSDGQVLTSTGSGVAWEAASGGIASLAADSSPQLGGILDTQGNDINASSGNLTLTRGGVDQIEINADGIEIKKRLLFNLSPGFGTGSMNSRSIIVGSPETAEDFDHDQANNVVIGHYAAQHIQEADYNVLIGDGVAKGDNNHSGGEVDESVVIGYGAMSGYGSGSGLGCTGNNVIGYGALKQITTGDYNIALGHQAGQSIRAGYYNVCIGGRETGNTLQSGNDNIVLGFKADVATESQQHAIVMGNNTTAAGNNTFTFGNSSTDSSVAFGATSITAPSDERYKEEISDATAGLSFIKDLRPVTFKWKKEKDIPDTQKAYVEASETRVVNDYTNHGFIAQEVKATIDAHPEIKNGFDMWVEDEADGRQRLGPSALIPMLVKSIQELSAENAALAARIEALE